MRALQLADLECATRAVLAVPVAERRAMIDVMLDAAAQGDACLRATGRAHPVHGTGTLMAVALRLPLVPRPAVLGPDYLHCLAQIAQQIAARSSCCDT